MGDLDKSPEFSTILARFAGDDGRRLLLEVLSDMSLLRGITDLDAFLNGTELVEVSQGQRVIEQGGADNEIYLVLSGRFEIVANGRTIATRSVGAHFGEMAMIDSTSRRSATVVAAEQSLVLKCSAAHFSSAANANPRMWRYLAIELSRRLKERNKYISVPRTEPVLFLGCSMEALDSAREIQAGFDYDPIVVEIWTDGVFNPSKTPIEDLTALIQRIDFGALLLTPDDVISSRKSEAFGPRDNVVFELGLIIGAIGRERTFMLVPRGSEVKLPSDLLGVKPIDYPTGDLSTIKSRLGPACNELRKIISRMGPL